MCIRDRLDTEITKSLVPTNDVIVGSELAFAPVSQANLTARKEWGMSLGNLGNWQLQMAMSEKRFSDIMDPNKAKQRGHRFVNMRYGMSNDEWTAELYIDNVTDERAEISNTFVFDRSRLSVINIYSKYCIFNIKFIFSHLKLL